MKKSTVYMLGMICLMGFTGCSAQADKTGDALETDTEQNNAAQKEQETPEAVEENEAKEDLTEENGAGEKQIENEPARGTDPAGKTVVYGQDGLYLSIDIPAGWDSEIKTKEDMEKEDGMLTCAIDFWPEEYPDTVFEFGYTPSYGICGTGVRIEEYTLPNGLGGYRYTETYNSENVLWMNITINNPFDAMSAGTYLIQGSPELSVWENIQPEFEEILETVWAGSLSGKKAAEGDISAQRTENGNSQFIEMEQAKNIALADAGLEPENVIFVDEQLKDETFDGGTFEYEFEFVTDTMKYEYEIDAKNGSVLKASQEEIDQIGFMQHKGITLDEAKKAALDYVGLAAGEVTFTKLELEKDDGVAEYEIEFYADKKEYSFSIDAASGKILETEIDMD